MIPKAISMDLRQIASLLIFFVFYVIFGGIVFMYLEAPLENQKREEIEKLLTEFREKLQMINHPNITEEHITTMIHKLLVAQDMNLVDHYGNRTHVNWNFFNSFFFAITVTTTIGYGHLSPYTVSGKIFCIIYALFGIPMTGVLIGGIGHRFSKCFSQNVSKAKSRYQRQLSARLIMLKKGLIFFVPWFIVFLVLPATIFMYFENWTFLEGFYYSFVTLATIGFGDYVAGSFEKEYTWIYKLVVVLWIVFGLAYLSMILNFISQGLRSRHLTNVVHSIRRISGPQFSHKLHQFNRMRRNRETFNRQQSVPIALLAPNGKIIRSNISLNTITSSSATPPQTPITSSAVQFSKPFIASQENSKSDKGLCNLFNRLLFFKRTPRHRKTLDRHDILETFLEANSPLRRTSSLPDIIGQPIASLDIEMNSNARNDRMLSLCNNCSFDCVVSMPVSETDQQLKQNNSNSELREDLVEKRKSFFIDMNSNPRIQITSV